MADSTGLMPNLYDPYAWMTDASIRGPGLYIDGFEVLPGQENIFFAMLSMGAGVVGPFGAKAYLGYDGSTYIDFDTGYGQIGDTIHLGVTSVRVEDSWTLLLTQRGGSVPTHYQQTLNEVFFLAKGILKRNKKCRELLSTDLVSHPFATNSVSESDLVGFLKRLKKHQIYYTTTPLEGVADTTGLLGSAFIRIGPDFFEASVGGWASFAGSPDRARVMILLHELGHATGAKAAAHYIAPENATPAQKWREWRETKAYNMRILKTCL
jgi:hypothetical protein